MRIWDATTGKVLYTLRGHANWVDRVAWSPDGQWIVSRDQSGATKIWDAVSGQELPDASLPATREGSSTSPDGHFRVELEGNDMLLIDIAKQARNKAYDRQGLRRWATTDPRWHVQQAEQARTAERPYAIAFYLDRLATLYPWRADHAAHAALAWVSAGQTERAAYMFVRTVLADPTTDMMKLAWLAERKEKPPGPGKMPAAR